ncbi:MAG: hypothetical protein M3487_00815, partial [Actinomycetota bacterium]|nr:hypothetical protein [Actinomycetota bacterium]
MERHAGFVDALLAAPLGVAWLGALEAEFRDDVPLGVFPENSRPGAIGAAADAVRARPLGCALAIAVDASYIYVGPMPSAAANGRRRGSSPCPGSVTTTRCMRLASSPAPACGPCPTRPPRCTAAWVEVWEMDPEPVSRWRLPVQPGSRIFEIHRPQDWAALVARCPAAARANHEEWELPGRQHEPGGLAPLAAIPGPARRADLDTPPCRAGLGAGGGRVRRRPSVVGRVPTSEGCVSDLGGGDVAMLRYWFSERTHWLADVFGAPQPMEAPQLGADGYPSGVDVRVDGARRRR